MQSSCWRTPQHFGVPWYDHQEQQQWWSGGNWTLNDKLYLGRKSCCRFHCGIFPSKSALEALDAQPTYTVLSSSYGRPTGWHQWSPEDTCAWWPAAGADRWVCVSSVTVLSNRPHTEASLKVLLPMYINKSPSVWESLTWNRMQQKLLWLVICLHGCFLRVLCN